jgi:hypothetical protein
VDFMTLLALLQAGGGLLQGAFGAAGAQQEANINMAMQRRRALRLGDVANMMENLNSMARLPQAYSRALSGTTGASRAAARMRGLGGSGAQAEVEARMQGEALASLADKVNQSEQQRLMGLAQIYSDPAFGALDQSEMPNANALIALQGLLGGGMATAPLWGQLLGKKGPGTLNVEGASDPFWDMLARGSGGRSSVPSYGGGGWTKPEMF